VILVVRVTKAKGRCDGSDECNALCISWIVKLERGFRDLGLEGEREKKEKAAS
jgi:hypothetical protein